MNAAFVFGGKDGYEDLSSVEQYDAASDTWSEVAPMQTARPYHNVCEISGALYVTGGLQRSVVLATVEKYSP